MSVIQEYEFRPRIGEPFKMKVPRQQGVYPPPSVRLRAGAGERVFECYREAWENEDGSVSEKFTFFESRR